jgi:superoxide oxidase
VSQRNDRKVPEFYRTGIKVLHWASLLLLVMLLGLGNIPALKWSFSAVVAIWAVGFGLHGVLATPGPALTVLVCKAFAPLHLALYVLLALTAVAVLRAGTGPLTGGARTLAIVALGAGLLHGCFHLWRHTALGDGALRNMLPKFMHKAL